MLEILNISVSVEEKDILKNFSLTVKQGEMHIIMGPNGVGKSTLGQVLMGNPNFRVKEGSITLNQTSLLGLPTHTIAKEGVFLGFQYPVTIPGLKISTFLRNLRAMGSREKVSIPKFKKELREIAKILDFPNDWMSRYLNEGFSGGEKKRLELLQLWALQPKIAFLDEIDSGVDIDAQKSITKFIHHMIEKGVSFIIVTHYAHMAKHLSPNKVHFLVEGTIQKSGGLELIETLEKVGFKKPTKTSMMKNSDSPHQIRESLGGV